MKNIKNCLKRLFVDFRYATDLLWYDKMKKAELIAALS